MSVGCTIPAELPNLPISIFPSKELVDLSVLFRVISALEQNLTMHNRLYEYGRSIAF